VLQMMQRPQAYDAGDMRNHDMNGMNMDRMDHAAMPVVGKVSAAQQGGTAIPVNSK
jgi:hypothetical protein